MVIKAAAARVSTHADRSSGDDSRIMYPYPEVDCCYIAKNQTYDTITNKKNNDKNKSVSFDTISVYNVKSRKDYTASEKLKTWYTVAEFLTMKNEALSLVKDLDEALTKKKVSSQVVDESCRGLERVRKGSVRNHTLRRKTLNLELAALRKKHNGTFRGVCLEQLGALFRSYTKESAGEARELGKEDEKQARAAYSEDSDFMDFFFRRYGGNAMLPPRKTPFKNVAPSSTSSTSTTSTSSSSTSSSSAPRQRTKYWSSKTTTNKKQQKDSSSKKNFRDGISIRLLAATPLR